MIRLPLSIAAALCLLAAGPLSAQAPRPGAPPRDNARPAPTGTARIRGNVLSAESGSPLRRAQVTLSAQELGLQRMVTTDAEGRYEFADLPAGRYTLAASKSGYVTLQYGQRRPFEPGRPVALGEGEVLGRLTVALPRGSVIAGKVTDEFGDPMAFAQVMAQRYQYGPGGQRRLGLAGPPATTDDLGQFRLFGLMPGEYIVSATVRLNMMTAGPGSAGDANEGYPPTYYPGTTNAAEAQPIVVGMAQEQVAYFSLIPARMSRVSGIVTDSQGRPAAGAMVMLRSGSMSMTMMSMGGAVASDGTFTIANVPPGDHQLDIRPQMRGPNAQAEFASVPLSVAGENVTGLRITTGPGAAVQGRVVFQGSASRTGGFGPLRVFVQPADPSLPNMMMGDQLSNGTVGDDGAFELKGLSGLVLFRVATPPAWTLKSVTLDGEDVTDVPYDLKGARTVGDLQIVLTDRLTDISGSVTDDGGRPVKDYVVVMVAEEVKDGVAAMRFTRTLRPDQDGRYRARGTPPGRYVIAALDTLEQGHEWDPEFQRRVRNAGKTFSVAEGQTITLDVSLRSGL